MMDAVVGANSRMSNVSSPTSCAKSLSAQLKEVGILFDLHHLNGKLLPFLDYNRRKYTSLSVHDYNSIEGLMWRLNAKIRNASFNLGGDGRVAQAFREVFLDRAELVAT